MKTLLLFATVTLVYYAFNATVAVVAVGFVRYVWTMTEPVLNIL